MIRLRELKVKVLVYAVLIAVSLLISPGSSIGAQSPGFTEDCISFDVSRMEVRRYSSSWKIVVGDLWLLDFGGNEREARTALSIIHHYGFNKHCFVGRPDPPMEYFLSDNRAPSGPMSGEDCIPFDPARLEIKNIGGRWKIVEGNRCLLDFGNDNYEAQKAIKIILKYGFTNICYVGRPQSSLTYFRADQHAGSGGTVPAVPSTSSAPSSAKPGVSSWDDSMYSSYDHKTFFNYAPAKQIIDVNNIDYPLLQAVLFYQTNRVRVNSNRSPLAYHSGCAGAAQMHARDMVDGKFFSHENPTDASKKSIRDRVDRFGIRWSWIGENINQGDGSGSYIDAARRYVDSWMNSSGHRANILNMKATHMGTGAYNAGSKWADLYFMAVQVFARVDR